VRAAVFADVGTVALDERAKPRIESGDDVLLDVEACGICGTDLHILDVPPTHPATPGVVLGHEIVGRVAEAGADVLSLRVGDRVVVAPNLWCGQCAWCRRGLRNQCENATTVGIFVDGGLAPHVRVPARACHPIAEHLPPHVAALAEPLSTVVHGARQAGVFPGEIAVVVGAGPVGLMFAALLTGGGARVLVVEPAAERAVLARTMGADVVVDPGRDDVAAVVREETGGLGAEVVVDAVGSQLSSALAVVGKGGRVVLFGMNTDARTEIAQAKITRDELTIVGAYVGQDVFPDAIRILESGRIDFEPLVTHRVGIDELERTMIELRAGRAAKVEVLF
jgi:2-desacetyl-2-hydroxyethyl bacteriochlorophyllide A dehydrogenase